MKGGMSMKGPSGMRMGIVSSRNGKGKNMRPASTKGPSPSSPVQSKKPVGKKAPMVKGRGRTNT